MRNQLKYPLLFALILAALALPGSASALVAPTTGGGKVGYLPLNSAPSSLSPQPLSVHATEPTGTPPLVYHGGPVMHSQKAFAIFWVAAGYSFPAGYEAAIESYLQDVAADSGKPSNVYSVSAQYTDETGHAAYQDSYGGSRVDTHAYGSTCPAYEGFFGAEFTACVTDEKMQEELVSEVEAEGLPHGLGVEYYIVLPPQVGSCFEGSGGPECFDEVFCAYHNYVEPQELVYSNISYSPEDPLGCGVEQYPNGHANGNADDTFSSLSHEANESITDPTLEAWYDEPEGFENGDECRGTKHGEDYGPPLGGSAGAETLFNQVIGSHHYYLQQEWSNDIEDCAQRVDPANPVISGPASAAPGQSIAFNGFSSTPGSGGIRTEKWEFGDGSGASGGEVTHSYSAPGTYTVTLTVTDDGGFAYSTSRQVAVNTPAPPSGGTASASGGSSRAGLAIAGAKAKVKKGVVALRLTCTGGGPCSGTIKLLDHGVIGHVSFHLSAGATKVVKVRLTSAGLALLAKKGGGLKVALSGAGVRHRTVTLVAG